MHIIPSTHCFLLITLPPNVTDYSSLLFCIVTKVFSEINAFLS